MARTSGAWAAPARRSSRSRPRRCAAGSPPSRACSPPPAPGHKCTSAMLAIVQQCILLPSQVRFRLRHRQVQQSTVEYRVLVYAMRRTLHAAHDMRPGAHERLGNTINQKGLRHYRKGHAMQQVICDLERTPMQKNRASLALYAGLIVAVLCAMKRASIATFSTLLRPQAGLRPRRHATVDCRSAAWARAAQQQRTGAYESKAIAG